MLKENQARSNALVEHLAECKVCDGSGDFCEAAMPLYDDFRTARMRSRLYFGEEIAIEDPDSDTDVPPIFPSEAGV